MGSLSETKNLVPSWETARGLVEPEPVQIICSGSVFIRNEYPSSFAQEVFMPLSKPQNN